MRRLRVNAISGRDTEADRCLPLMSSPIARKRSRRAASLPGRIGARTVRHCGALFTGTECTCSAHSRIDDVPDEMTLMQQPAAAGKVLLEDEALFDLRCVEQPPAGG